MKPETSNFYDKVYEVANLIPFGRVTSYGAIAKYLGAARSARMVARSKTASASASMDGAASSVVCAGSTVEEGAVCWQMHTEIQMMSLKTRRRNKRNTCLNTLPRLGRARTAHL